MSSPLSLSYCLASPTSPPSSAPCYPPVCELHVAETLSNILDTRHLPAPGPGRGPRGGWELMSPFSPCSPAVAGPVWRCGSFVNVLAKFRASSALPEMQPFPWPTRGLGGQEAPFQTVLALTLVPVASWACSQLSPQHPTPAWHLSLCRMKK